MLERRYRNNVYSLLHIVLKNNHCSEVLNITSETPRILLRIFCEILNSKIMSIWCEFFFFFLIIKGRKAILLLIL